MLAAGIGMGSSSRNSEPRLEILEMSPGEECGSRKGGPLIEMSLVRAPGSRSHGTLYARSGVRTLNWRTKGSHGRVSAGV